MDYQRMGACLLLLFGVFVFGVITIGFALTAHYNDPYDGNFTITSLSPNDETYWKYPTTYGYTLRVSTDNGDTATVYASQYFVNRHPLGVRFSGSTVKMKDYNDHQILIFSIDTPDTLRQDHPEIRSDDGCPVNWPSGDLIGVAYYQNYHEIPNDGAHYWAYYLPNGTGKDHLTLNQVVDYINAYEGRKDCIYVGTGIHDYWENDAGPMFQYGAIKYDRWYRNASNLTVNFAPGVTVVATPVPTRMPLPKNPDSKYGCPGCHPNFMSFARDMCSRNLVEGATVGDGVNTLKCSEIGEE